MAGQIRLCFVAIGVPALLLTIQLVLQLCATTAVAYPNNAFPVDDERDDVRFVKTSRDDLPSTAFQSRKYKITKKPPVVDEEKEVSDEDLNDEDESSENENENDDESVEQEHEYDDDAVEGQEQEPEASQEEPRPMKDEVEMLHEKYGLESPKKKSKSKNSGSESDSAKPLKQKKKKTSSKKVVAKEEEQEELLPPPGPLVELLGFVPTHGKAPAKKSKAKAQKSSKRTDKKKKQKKPKPETFDDDDYLDDGPMSNEGGRPGGYGGPNGGYSGQGQAPQGQNGGYQGQGQQQGHYPHSPQKIAQPVSLMSLLGRIINPFKGGQPILHSQPIRTPVQYQ